MTDVMNGVISQEPNLEILFFHLPSTFSRVPHLLQMTDMPSPIHYKKLAGRMTVSHFSSVGLLLFVLETFPN